MESMEYSGFTIFSKTHQLRDSLKWTLEVQIMKRDKVQAFSAKNTFDTEAEAREQAILFGRRIIDGEVPGLTIDELLGP